MGFYRQCPKPNFHLLKFLTYRHQDLNILWYNTPTVKILKFGTPQTIAIIVLKIEKFDVTLH